MLPRCYQITIKMDKNRYKSIQKNLKFALKINNLQKFGA